MCIQTKVQKLQAQKEALDAQIKKLEKLESATFSVKNLLVSLLADYATEASEELPIIWEEILAIGQQHGLSVQPLAANELQQWEADRVELENLRPEVRILRSQFTQVQSELKNIKTLDKTESEATAELSDKEPDSAYSSIGWTKTYEEVSAASPEYEPEEASDTVESVLKAKGFFQPNNLENYDSNEKYETYRGWDIYHGVPNGGIVSIGFYDIANNQPWDVSTEYIQEVDPTFPESLGDFDAIVKWTRALIDQVENVKAPGQLSLEFLESTSEQEDKKEVTPEQTELQKLLAGNSLIDCILISHGFFMPDMKIGDQYSEDEKYEDYQGWASYRQSHDRGVTGIGLYHEKFGFWDASTEMIGEDDTTFPEDFSDGDAILTWLRSVIDEIVAITPITPVENSEVPGQLSLKFLDPIAVPEQTKLQKLLEGNSNFTFEELGVSVKIQSVFTDEEIESEDKNESDDPATEKVEEALIIACNAEGRHWRYYVNAQTFIYQYTIDSLEQAALGYAQHFLRDLEKEAKKNTQWNAENAQQSESAKPETETEFEMMGLKVRVHPQLPMGVTFRFLNPDNTFYFSNSLISAEIGDRTWKVCASDLIQNYRDKEAARIDKEANPYKKPEDEFVEFVKISNAVGHLKRRDNDQLIAGYAAFSNKLPDGHRAGTQAKSRAAKWAEWLKGTFKLECDAPRIAKRIISDNSKQSFAYEVKIKGVSIGQLTKLAEEDFSLLPGEVEEQQLNTELLQSETKASPTSPGEIEQATEPRNDGLTDEQYSKAVEELALDDDDSSELATPPVKFTGLALTPECGLNEDEIELVKMAKAAILECDSEMVKSVNSVFKEVCEKNAANRVKVWTALTEEQQQTYKLLLQMEFAKAPDFAEQTPEYIVTIDSSKLITNVWISLREVDGKLARVWRYKGQKDEIGYATKEAAAIAAISQQAG